MKSVYVHHRIRSKYGLAAVSRFITEVSAVVEFRPLSWIAILPQGHAKSKRPDVLCLYRGTSHLGHYYCQIFVEGLSSKEAIKKMELFSVMRRASWTSHTHVKRWNHETHELIR